MTFLSLSDEIFVNSCFVVGASGFLANTFLLVLASRKKELRQREYMPFVINRCLIDVLFCLHVIILQPLGVRFWYSDPIYCQIAGGFCLGLIMAMLLSETVLAFNRFVHVCHRNRYQQIYRRQRVYAMCFLVWVSGFFLSAIHVLDDSFGRVSGYYCCLKIEKQFMILLISTDYPVLLSSYGLVLFCYVKILIFIRRHQEQVNGNNRSTRLTEDKSLLRYIGAIALLPLATDTPVSVATIVYVFAPDLVPSIVLALGSVWIFFCPLLNALFTLFMLRPIRNEVQTICRRLFKDNNNTVVPMTIIVQSTRGTF